MSHTLMESQMLIQMAGLRVAFAANLAQIRPTCVRCFLRCCRMRFFVMLCQLGHFGEQ